MFGKGRFVSPVLWLLLCLAMTGRAQNPQAKGPDTLARRTPPCLIFHLMIKPYLLLNYLSFSNYGREVMG
jgi:hypothetical protein